jgi:hypothetical protein
LTENRGEKRELKKIWAVIIIGLLCFSMFSIFPQKAKAENGRALETVIVGSDGATYYSTIVLQAGVQYTIEVSGTYVWGYPTSQCKGDAMYGTKDSWATYWSIDSDTGGIMGGLYMVGWDAPNFKPWGEYNSEHEYYYALVGTGYPVGFLIWDSAYWDNSGSLTVKIYPDSDPVGYWKFDEGSGNTAKDSSSNGNDGAIYSPNWVDGKVGKALHFNGVDGWVDIPHNPTLSGFSQMTMEAWIEMDSFQDRVKGIVCKASGTAMPTPDSEYALVLFNTTPAFEVCNGNYLVRAFGSQKTPNTGTWYHIAGTWSGTTYAFYVNGVLCDSGTNSPSAPYSYPIDLQIGRIGTYSWTYFSGIIDEVKIYNYARTADQILADYTSGQQYPITLNFAGADEIVGNDGQTGYTLKSDETNLYMVLNSADFSLVPSPDPNPLPNMGALVGMKTWCMFTPTNALQGSFTITFPSVMDYEYKMTGIIGGNVRADISIIEQGKSDLDALASQVGYQEDFWCLGSDSGGKSNYNYNIASTFNGITLNAGATYKIQLDWAAYASILIGGFMFGDSQEYQGANFWSRLHLTQPYISGESVSSQTASLTMPSGLVVTAHSPVALSIIDSEGRRTGWNPITETETNDIPAAFYSGVNSTPQSIAVPYPESNTYSLQVFGTGTGNYGLTAYTVDSQQVVTSMHNYLGNIASGESQTFLMQISGKNLTFYKCAYVHIDPRSLNLVSKGEWITAYIELGKSFNMQNTNISSIMLNGTIPVAPSAPVTIGDYDSDGIPDLMVKFNRSALESFIYNKGIRYGNVALTITGELLDGTPFKGTGVIFANYAGDANNDRAINIFDILAVKSRWETTPDSSSWVPDYDVNGDEAINIFDVLIIKSNWGQTTP